MVRSVISGFVLAADSLNKWIAEKIVSLLIFPLIVVVGYGVIGRYILHTSTLWVPEVATYLYATTFMCGGGYALYTRSHVGLDVLVVRLSLRGQAVLRLASSIFLLFFSSALLWKGIEFAGRALAIREHSLSAFSPPVYPIKMVVPLSAFLLLFQGLAIVLRDILYLTGGFKQ